LKTSQFVDVYPLLYEAKNLLKVVNVGFLLNSYLHLKHMEYTSFTNWFWLVWSFSKNFSRH